jgi:hypothetical protein
LQDEGQSNRLLVVPRELWIQIPFKIIPSPSSWVVVQERVCSR